jgi:hypothetical protein|tara:strand:+ start:72 stop:332 length:261 start_codon:yes stop_codon:yes gene_type:complete
MVMTRKGYNNITDKVQEIWKIDDLKLAKQKLIDIVDNDLSKIKSSESNRIWKMKMYDTINKLSNLDQVYQKATDILVQDNNLTRTR